MTTYNQQIPLRFILSGLSILFFMSCERVTDGLDSPSYSNNPEVFIDGFSSGLDYAAFGGSVPTAFNIDTDVTYHANSKASMRFEVPDVGDPRGTYAGGVFFTSAPRDLSEYDALTFWAKGSQPAALDLIGFGNDLGANTYQASIAGLNVNTNWKKYIIPIPDPSRLTQERGMFFYSVGAIDGKGFTFWIDNVKFEKLGTVAHPKATILNGEDQTETTFTGISRTVGGLTAILNLPTGVDQPVNVTPAYFEFSSSNPSVATVNESGVVSIVGGPDTAVITATMAGSPATGSLTVNSQGTYVNAPEPTRDPANVISIFSDAYNDVPVEYYNGFWAPFQTTQSADFTINGDNVLHYTNFNFVGIQFSTPTVDATSMTHIHLDLYFPNAIQPGTQFRVQLVDFGADGAFGGGNDTSHTITFSSPPIVAEQWVSLDIPLTSFTGLTGRANLAQIIFEGVNIPSFYADNIYFYQQ